MRKTIVLLCCVALTPALLTAQDGDPHFDCTLIAPIAHRSTFLHGYLHGYEEGFHQGDFDLQMGRISRGDNNADASPKGYKKEFGPKAMYKTGFHEGFAVGYADAAGGRRFRAVQNVLTVVAANPAEGPIQPAAYDLGMRTGYVAGQHQGLADARRELPSKPTGTCPAQTNTTHAGFCAAYVEGFQLGYSDGFTNQAKTTLAQK